jgi:hypothetical protein
MKLASNNAPIARVAPEAWLPVLKGPADGGAVAADVLVQGVGVPVQVASLQGKRAEDDVVLAVVEHRSIEWNGRAKGLRDGVEQRLPCEI